MPDGLIHRCGGLKSTKTGIVMSQPHSVPRQVAPPYLARSLETKKILYFATEGVRLRLRLFRGAEFLEIVKKVVSHSVIRFLETNVGLRRPILVIPFVEKMRPQSFWR